MGLAAPGEAIYTMTILKALRSGRTESAVDLLEVELDSHIAAWVVVDDMPLRFDWMGLEAAGSSLAPKVLDYRREHPREDASGRRVVERLHAIHQKAQRENVEPAVPADAAKEPRG
jgi:hypothetical protein